MSRTPIPLHPPAATGQRRRNRARERERGTTEGVAPELRAAMPLFLMSRMLLSLGLELGRMTKVTPSPTSIAPVSTTTSP